MRKIIAAVATTIVAFLVMGAQPAQAESYDKAAEQTSGFQVVKVSLPKSVQGKAVTIGCETDAGLQGFHVTDASRKESVIVRDTDTLTGCTFYNGKKVIKVKRYSITNLVPALPLQEIGQPVYYGGEMVTLDIDGTIIAESGVIIEPKKGVLA
jgi:hypothetical protein